MTRQSSQYNYWIRNDALREKQEAQQNIMHTPKSKQIKPHAGLACKSFYPQVLWILQVWLKASPDIHVTHSIDLEGSKCQTELQLSTPALSKPESSTHLLGKYS